MSLKKQVFEQCILSSMIYGCKHGHQLKILLSNERKILKIELEVKDTILNREIRTGTRVKGVVEFSDR